MIRAKAGEYMERAEKLKNHLADTDKKKKPSAVGANGKVSGGSGKGKYVVISLVPVMSAECM
jgi:vacuolar protein-sorting-associated protein 4